MVKIGAAVDLDRDPPPQPLLLCCPKFADCAVAFEVFQVLTLRHYNLTVKRVIPSQEFIVHNEFSM